MQEYSNESSCRSSFRVIDIRTARSPIAQPRSLADLVASTICAAARSDHTARSYRNSIGLFVQYLDTQRGDLLPEAARQCRPFAEPTKEPFINRWGCTRQRTVWVFRGTVEILRLVDAGALDGFQSWRADVGDNLNTIATRMSAIKSFLNVACRDGVLTNDQVRALGVKAYRQRQKRDAKPVGRRLLPSEVRKLRCAVTTDTVKGKRDAAIIDLMLFLGLRRQEVADLRTKDFKYDSGYWWVFLTGKGAKTRRLKLHDAVISAVNAWMEVLGLEMGVNNDPVFCAVSIGGRPGRAPIYSSTIGRIVAEYGYAAGIAPLTGSNRLSPHDLRRTMARNAYDNGATLLQVQQWLGHADPKTTARYIGAYQQDDDMAVDYVSFA